MKPVPTCTLRKGRLIDTQPGFVDTFEWMKKVCGGFKGDGMFVVVRREDQDAPVITLSDGMLDILQQLASGNGPDMERYGTFRFEPNVGTTSSDQPYGRFTQCRFTFGRQVIDLAPTTVSNIVDGRWWIRIPHSSPSSATVFNLDESGQSAVNTLTQTCMPIATISGQKVVTDYRPVVVPVWGSETT